MDKNWKAKAIGGLKNIHHFGQALAAMTLWILIKYDGLWLQVIKIKYMDPLSIEEQIRQRNKPFPNASTMWKALVLTLPLLGKWKVWKLGNGQNIKLGVDPWIGCENKHILSEGIGEKLSQKGITHLADTTDMGRGNLWHHRWKEARDLGILQVEKTDARVQSPQFHEDHNLQIQLLISLFISFKFLY